MPERRGSVKGGTSAGDAAAADMGPGIQIGGAARQSCYVITLHFIALSRFVSMPLRLPPAVLGTLALAAAFSPGPGRGDTPIRVVATFSVLADMVGVVGTERVSVIGLVKGEQEMHGFQPTPSAARVLAGAHLVVSNGLGLEPWLPGLLRAVKFNGRQVEASRGLTPLPMRPHRHTEGRNTGTERVEPDPHAWHDPRNGQVYFRNIAAALAAIDAAGAAIYTANAATAEKRLQSLDAEARRRFDAIAPQRRRAIAGHDSFAYLAMAYRLELVPAAGGISEATQSAAAFRRLLRQMQENKIELLFLDDQSNPTVIEAIRRETGARIGGRLYSDAVKPGKIAGTYIEMLQHNIHTLLTAFESN
jgi:zinc/manganese transport system substrate-binding protein